jgi:hypothetical protein
MGGPACMGPCWCVRLQVRGLGFALVTCRLLATRLGRHVRVWLIVGADFL